ncbi:MAG TPA: hypothetical protein VJ813_00540 [Vicinamibacterales bacterium]|nr:hypothetical protein [Vicinamibacterales bacterium]
MKTFRNMAGVAALVACVGCADTMNDNPPVSGPEPVGTTGTRNPSDPTQVNPGDRGEVPVGQLIDVRLQTTLSSATATKEQRFEATTAADLMQGSTVLIPAGSTVRGVVSDVEKAGNIDRTGNLALAFDQIVIRGREYPLRAMATQVFESRGVLDEGKTVGTAGAVGAIVGGILGGLKGALLGAVVGSGGVIAATEGKDIELPAGTIIRVRLDSPLQLR